MPQTTAPTSSIEVQTREMFTRVLAAWASDLLGLRRAGLDVPGDRDGAADVVTPSISSRGRGGDLRWCGGDVAAGLRWRPAA